ncbi:MAG: hypothetical protein JWO26_103 [Rhodospirillales bacterium]|jgi:hypothetical protein|nr:hypothetical protein [Rhodospirillales bacterium]MDB5380471.1 hypothetical protein [Rhodospirillales bacterium]
MSEAARAISVTPLTYVGTFSPSRRQIRSTRFTFTTQPQDRSSAAILR